MLTDNLIGFLDDYDLSFMFDALHFTALNCLDYLQSPEFWRVDGTVDEWHLRAGELRCWLLGQNWFGCGRRSLFIGRISVPTCDIECRMGFLEFALFLRCFAIGRVCCCVTFGWFKALLLVARGNLDLQVKYWESINHRLHCMFDCLRPVMVRGDFFEGYCFSTPVLSCC